MFASTTNLRLGFVSVVLGSMLTAPALSLASVPAPQPIAIQSNSQLNSEVVKLWLQRNKQTREIQGIQKQLEKTASDVSDLAARIEELQLLMTDLRANDANGQQTVEEALSSLSATLIKLESKTREFEKSSSFEIGELQKRMETLSSSVSRLDSSVSNNSTDIQRLIAHVATAEQDRSYIAFIIAAIAMAMAIAAIAIIMGKRFVAIAKDNEALREQVEDLKIKQTENLLKDSEQLAAIAEASAQMQKAVKNLHEQASAVSILATPAIKATEPDHSLIKVIADRLAFMQVTLYRMESSVRGHRQLTRSLKQINDNLLAYGYEIVDLLGQPYSEGMKVTANFVEDESLKPGTQIITGISKPQINYNGRMIQSAQVTVSQNLC